jgi:hypothetical protein
MLQTRIISIRKLCVGKIDFVAVKKTFTLFQHGLIVVDNSTYEVRPLPAGPGRSDNGDGRTAHVIRRAPPPTPPFDDALLLRPQVRRPRTAFRRQILKPPPSSYTIEVALFLDEAGYKLFHPFLNYNEADLRDMLLAYINGVSCFFFHK